MNLRVSGNLKSVIKKYQKYRDTLIDKMNTAVAKEVKILIREEFRDQKDPYGNSWDPDKTGTVFDPKHSIQRAFKVEKTATGVEVYNTLDFAIYHQTGTDKLPQRMMLPDPNKGLGDWGDNIIREMENAALGITLVPLKESD